MNIGWVVAGVLALMFVAYIYATKRREGFQMAANSDTPVTGDSIPYTSPDMTPEMKEETCKKVVEHLEEYKKYKEQGRKIEGLDSAIEQFTNFTNTYKCV